MIDDHELVDPSREVDCPLQVSFHPHTKSQVFALFRDVLELVAGVSIDPMSLPPHSCTSFCYFSLTCGHYIINVGTFGIGTYSLGTHTVCILPCLLFFTQ